jgi:hypothetical protein
MRQQLERLTMKVITQKHGGGTTSQLFRCPGCDMHHVVYTSGAGVPHWDYNGNADAPTFRPSVLVTWTQWVPPITDAGVKRGIMDGTVVQTQQDRVCHSFITDGKIQYLGDCTHSLAGQTVDLPDTGEND